jgi:hypothetical protein
MRHVRLFAAAAACIAIAACARDATGPERVPTIQIRGDGTGGGGASGSGNFTCIPSPTVSCTNTLYGGADTTSTK